MSKVVDFEGQIVRVEQDGFGIVEFGTLLGDKTHGFFSSVMSEKLPPLRELRRGSRVAGKAEIEGGDLATVKILDVIGH